MASYAVERPKGIGNPNHDWETPNAVYIFDTPAERDKVVEANASFWQPIHPNEAKALIALANKQGNGGRTPGDGRRDSRSWNFVD